MPPSWALRPSNGRTGLHAAGTVVRTPLLPFDTLENGLTADEVRALVSERVVREALLLASPTLDEAIDSWLADPSTRRAHDAERTIVHYLTRMASRCTPFGLFAGCAAAKIGTSTSLAIGDLHEARRKTRIDLSYLMQIAATLELPSNLSTNANLTLNTSITLHGNNLRYWASAKLNSPSQTSQYHQFETPLTPALRTSLAAASSVTTLREIVHALTSNYPTVTTADAVNFVNELIESQVLCSNLPPAMTGEDPFDDLARTLEGADRTGRIAERLANVRQNICTIDEFGVGAPSDMYRQLVATLAPLGVPPAPKGLLHVDLFRPNDELSIGERVIAETRRGIRLLHRITPVRGSPAMHRFRERFVQRYGDREILLAEALDEEHGVGFEIGGSARVEQSSLLAGIVLPPPRREQEVVDKSDHYKLRRLLTLLDSACNEWELTEADLEMLAVEEQAPLPDAILAMIGIAATSSDEIDRGNFELLLSNVTGPSGISTIARFCHGDMDIRALVERHIRTEERCRSDAIFAEIVHLPDGIAGSILSRPVLRSHEISYLGRSGAPREAQIGIDDLRVCVRDGLVRLRSTRLGREVIPRLSNGHNYENSPLTIYKFLCALQYEGVAHALRWDWGMLRNSPFLPRVRYGRIVLAPAIWTLPANEVDELMHARFTRAGRALPRWVSIVDDDRLLPIDLRSDRAARQLRSFARRHEFLKLQELFPAPEQMCARGPRGRYAHEILIPFTRTGASPVQSLAQPPPLPRERLFPPGSQWLYSKIYIGSATADDLLRNVVSPLIRALRASAQIENWFFVRYADPDPHIRLRLEGEAGQLVREVLPLLRDKIGPLLVSGHVARIEFATYERELERYGGFHAISLVERIFTADSNAAVAIVETTDSAFKTNTRWQWALVGLHSLLTDAGLDEAARLALLRCTLDAFTKARRVDAAVRRSLAARYRTERTTVESLIGNQSVDDGSRLFFEELIAARSQIATPAFKQLHTLGKRGLLETPMDELLRNILHMHVNRVLPSDHLLHEIALYYFLHRAYASMAVRS